jgi:hypothetical protein
VRDEEADASLGRGDGEDVEERGAEPLAPHRVRDGERHLGGVGALRKANEASDADDLAASVERHDRDVVLAVDGREVRQHRGREVREVREEPLVA